jgi:hypothetical protein
MIVKVELLRKLTTATNAQVQDLSQKHFTALEGELRRFIRWVSSGETREAKTTVALSLHDIVAGEYLIVHGAWKLVSSMIASVKRSKNDVTVETKNSVYRVTTISY